MDEAADERLGGCYYILQCYHITQYEIVVALLCALYR